MSNPSSDSYRNITRYQGQDYSFAPRYLRARDPTTSDIKPKEQQGHYPLGSLWTNSSNSNLWALANITNNLAKWVLLSGGTGPLIKIGVPNGTSPINPDTNGLISFTSTGATVTITGSAGGLGAQNINFDVNAAAILEKLAGDDAAPVVPTAGQINLTGITVLNATNAKPVFFKKNAGSTEELDVQLATTSTSVAKNINNAGLASYSSTQFAIDAPTGFVTLAGGGTNKALQTITGDSGGAVIPDANNNINHVSDANYNTLGGVGILTGSASTLTLNLTRALSSPTAIGNTAANTGQFTAIGVNVAAPAKGIELASTNGIKFDTSSGANTAAPPLAVATSNTLTIYEEGTFTPTLVGHSVAGTTTYTAQVGRYVRIGNWVWIQYAIGISAATGTGVADFTMPFTSANTVIIASSMGSHQDQGTGAITLSQSYINTASAISNLRDNGSTVSYAVENASRAYQSGLFFPTV